MRKQTTLCFFITILSTSLAIFQWPLSGKRTDKPLSFFERSDLKVTAVTESPSCCYRVGDPKLYYSPDKWRKGQDTAQRAREASALQKKKKKKKDETRKYFGLHQKERSVVYSKPPCLPGQRVDQRGFCRNIFLLS